MYMKKMISAACACSMFMSSLMAPTVSHANIIEDFFDDVWVQTTSARVYDGQRRGGLIGGSVTVRIPARSFSLLAFTEPSFEAGCGGIDVNAGSFTFINGEELIALLKQIGQQAKALLFKIAIDSINALLGGLITEFQQKVQAMNAMLSNTCSIAQGAVNFLTADQEKDQGANKWQGAWDKVTGLLDDDYMAGFKDQWEKGKARFKEKWSAAGDAGAPAGMPFYGNSVMRSGMLSPSLGLIQFGSVRKNDEDWNRGSAVVLLMNLFGTSVFNADRNEMGDGATNPSECASGAESRSADANAECARLTTVHQRTISSLDQLTYAGENLIMMCDGDGEKNDSGTNWGQYLSGKPRMATADVCLKINDQYPLKKFFPGTAAMVNKLLWGVNKDYIPPAEKIASTKGLVRYLQGNPAAISSEEIGILSSMDTPVLSILRKVQRDPGAVENVAELMSLQLAERESIRIGRSALTAARGLFANSKQDFVKPPKWDENIALFSREVELKESQSASWMEVIESMAVYADRVYGSLNMSAYIR